MNPPPDELLGRVTAQFGGVRAEYFRQDLFTHFTAPSYWPELLTPRPSFLVGGRGTGKTTVLRSLSYQGQNVLEPSRLLEDWSHIGIYWRIDTNVAKAFAGARLNEDEWARIFGHYINLKLVASLAEFVLWAIECGHLRHDHVGADLVTVCVALGIPPVAGWTQLRSVVRNALVEFEVSVNNADDSMFPVLSVQGRPLHEMVDIVAQLPGMGTKTVFFLIDEFENLENYQQRCFNTLIKHSGDARYTFKVGLRETGHREKATSNGREILVEPADFALIDIREKLKERNFAAFAARVCSQRLSRIVEQPAEIEAVLPGITAEEEANRLGAAARRNEIRLEVRSEENQIYFDGLSNLRAVFLGYWAASRSMKIDDAIEEFRTKSVWTTRLNNYQYAMLFTLRRGLPGRRKYYAGWDTFAVLADGNIRYMLQLVGEALLAHVAEGKDFATPVSPETQTDAAQSVGSKIVRQLPGITAQGAQLTRLVLGLGRVFQVMASQPEGHAPEVNQFRTDAVPTHAASELLDAAVMHLALVRFPSDKRAESSGETRDWNYQLHPIFAPFFVYSHRRKRKVVLSSLDLIGFVRSPAAAIEKVLLRNSRQSTRVSLPDQLALFEDFYDDLV